MKSGTLIDMDMKLVRAQAIEADARLIMEWRNDPLTRRMSFHQEPKQMPDFMDEFVEGYFSEPSLPPLFGEVDGQRVGFLRFRVYDESIPRACDIGVMVRPDQRGKGVGQKLVTLGTAFVHKQGWQTVVAEIRQENTASLRLFSKAGYRELDTHQRVFDDLPQSITVLRYIHREEAG